MITYLFVLGVLLMGLGLLVAGRGPVPRKIKPTPDYRAIDRMEREMDICGVRTEQGERLKAGGLLSTGEASLAPGERFLSPAEMKAEFVRLGVPYDEVRSFGGGLVRVVPRETPKEYQMRRYAEGARELGRY